MSTLTNLELLECGHPESPHSDITRGYGTMQDGSRHCYDCCLKKDLETMREQGRIGAYLDGDGKRITTWTGQELAKVTRAWETSAGGWARRTNITRVQATAADGSLWYGSGPGNGMYIRLKRYGGKRAR